MLALAGPASAQPAPNARPIGGQIVGGSATIGRTATTTTITQSTHRAAVNWTSFNVGRDQKVDFQQPSSSAVTLNRVTGPDPSAIAGKITANGQLVLTNASGIVFYQGAQVNAQALVASAPGISTANFMAGKLIFDEAPRPGAVVSNAGDITVRQTGLAAFVAPGVANSGTITAPMGHVVLAGAEAHTVDLYGDGMLSIDVTRQVRTAPVGANGQKLTALVTNTGLIVAEGGTVTLTAAAADGIVQNLVNAGGRIQTPTKSDQAGRIEILGTGGSVVVTGQLAARGTAPGTTGGEVVVNATQGVTLAPTARVSASGRAGGGTVAVGTTLARAKGGSSLGYAGAAATTTVAQGARISANGGRSGTGGNVTVLSTSNTTMAGSIAAKGGTTSGNGGFVEISGNGGFHITGQVDTSAANGLPGTILLDPRTLTITTAGTNNNNLLVGTDPNLPANSPDTATDVIINPTIFSQFSGGLHLQATNDLIVASSFKLAYYQALNLEAGHNLTVNADVSITGGQSITLTAASAAIPGYSATGVLSVLGTISTPSSQLTLGSQTGGIVLGGTISAGAITFNTTGAVSQTGGSVTSTTIDGTAASFALVRGNAIDGISSAGLTATTGGITITEAAGKSFTASGPMTAAPGQTIAINADAINEGSPSSYGGASVLPAISTSGGTVSFSPVTPGRDIELLAQGETATTGRLSLSDALLSQVQAGTLRVGTAQSGNIFVGLQPSDTITAPTAILALFGGGAITQSAVLNANTLVASAASITLDNAFNGISELGPISATGAISVASNYGLIVTGPVTSTTSNVTLSGGYSQLQLAGDVTGATVGLTGGFINQTAGSITAATLNAYASGTEGGVDITLTQPTNRITNLGSVTSAYGTIEVVNAIALRVTGPVLSVFSNVSLTTVHGDLTLSGDVSAGQSEGGPGIVNLVSGDGQIVQNTGSIIAGQLTGSATSASFGSPTNQVLGLGPFTTSAGGFSLTDAVPLTLFGTVSVPNGQTIALTADALTEPAFGQLLAPGGTVALAPLTNGLGIELYVTGLPTVGVLAVGPSLLGSISAGTLQLTTGGVIAIGQAGDAVDLRPNVATLSVIAGGAVTEGGTLAVSRLTGSAAVATLPAANTIDTLGAFQTTAGFALADGTGLVVTGPLVAPTVSLQVAGPLVFAGNVTTNALSFADTGAVTQAAGALTVSNVSGAASGSIQLGGTGGTAAIAAIGGIATPGSFSLTDTTALTVAGPLAASSLAIAAPGQITLASGTIALTGASASSITVTPRPDGSGDLVQAGLTTATSANGGAPTLQLQAPGTIRLAQLTAPTVNLVLSSSGGVLTGNIIVAGLRVLGVSGSANLFGTVAQVAGAPAAMVATIVPAINTRYLLNGCIIASATCQPVTPPIAMVSFNAGQSPNLLLPEVFKELVPPLTPPSFTPLALTITHAFEDADILLPNISDRDY